MDLQLKEKTKLTAKEQYRLAFDYVEAGELTKAERCLRSLMDAHARQPDVLHLLGVVLMDLHQLNESISLLHDAVEQYPENERFQYHYGLSLVRSGMFEKAIEAFKKTLEINPDFHDARYNLAKAFKDSGNLTMASHIYKTLLDLEPSYIGAFYNLANLYHEQDRLQQAAGLYKKVLANDPNHLNALTNLALIKSKQGARSEAIKDLEKLLEIESDHKDAKDLLRRLNSQLIPGWHFDMLNDSERNKAYDRAITRAAAGAKHVLEIGTGSGLLAMMAARAGAKGVTTCEMVESLAGIARKVIQRNGYADRIRVVAKKSTLLQIGEDMPEPADVLIAEVFDVGLLGEHFLPALQHAKRNLLTDNAVIIPASVKIFASLIECPDLRRVNPIGNIAGFDLSEFDIFRPPGYTQVEIHSVKHRDLSDPFEVCHIDFQKGESVQSDRIIPVIPAKSGTCHAIVFWFELHLDRDTIINTRNSAKTNHWKQAIQFFDQDHDVVSGSPLNVSMILNQTELSFSILS